MKPRLIVLLIAFLGFSAQVSGQEIQEPGSQDLTKQVRLYPNPAIEFLNVKFETPQAKKAKFVLHNILGSEVEVEQEIIDDFEVRIRVKELNTGFYLLLVRNEETGLKGAYKFLKR